MSCSCALLLWQRCEGWKHPAIRAGLGEAGGLRLRIHHGTCQLLCGHPVLVSGSGGDWRELPESWEQELAGSGQVISLFRLNSQDGSGGDPGNG